MALMAGLSMLTSISAQAQVSAEPLQVYAAGSLRTAFTQIAKDFEAQGKQTVQLTFGASGLLRERIEKGEGAELFASADTDHPQCLAQKGAWGEPQVFTRNALCALTAAAVQTSPETMLATLLSPQIRVAISTPKADPAGDYAWAYGMTIKAAALPKAQAFASYLLSAPAQAVLAKLGFGAP
jgi:molybdate transport system substrate-binding protein